MLMDKFMKLFKSEDTGINKKDEIEQILQNKSDEEIIQQYPPDSLDGLPQKYKTYKFFKKYSKYYSTLEQDHIRKIPKEELLNYYFPLYDYQKIGKVFSDTGRHLYMDVFRTYITQMCIYNLPINDMITFFKNYLYSKYKGIVGIEFKDYNLIDVDFIKSLRKDI